MFTIDKVAQRMGGSCLELDWSTKRDTVFPQYQHISRRHALDFRTGSLLRSSDFAVFL